MDEVAELRRRLSADGQLSLFVKVTPKSSRTRIIGRMVDGTLKIAVAAAPEKGRANAALCDFLARELGIPKSAVSVESGHTSSRKRMKIVNPG
jgi:uncharacterized protein (TIGR00251 family)